MLRPWESRPIEEATLFNPAFCGVLIFEFVKEYTRARASSCSFALPFCAIPIVVHRKTRSLLPPTTLTSMHTWRERNPEVLVGYPERAIGLRPVLQEAVRFCLDRKALIVSANGELSAGTLREYSRQINDTLTTDTKECIESCRMLARWFAKAGTAPTILASWGIKP